MEGTPNYETAPVVFVLSSSSSSASSDCCGHDDGHHSAGSLHPIKCPLCYRLSQSITCKECLLRGEFNHSSPVAGRLRERFSDLKLKLLKLRKRRNELGSQCLVFTERKEHIAQLVEGIESYQNTTLLQRDLKSNLQQRIADVEREAESMRKSSAKIGQEMPIYKKRVENMQDHFRHRTAKLKKFQAVVDERKELLKNVSKSRILQLKEFVFPIQVVDQERDEALEMQDLGSFDDDDEEEDDTVSALMMATSNYWGRPDDLISTFGTCHGFGQFGPSLPASGDYSAHNMWTENKSHGLLTGPQPPRNPAQVISAALSYTTQFVNLVAYYLDLRLPHRLSFSEFTVGDLSGGNFNRKVAKLNANVIHLCASQGVPPTFLQPRHTITNLLTLFDPEVADLGRRGPFEVATQLAKSMEASIEKDLVICEGDSSDSDGSGDCDNFPSDWENVQRATITDEMSCQNMTNHNQSYFQSVADQSDFFTRSRNASLASGGGLVSSISSFFKGWGGK